MGNDVSIEVLVALAARNTRDNVPDWCGVAECGKPHRALNLCMNHYLRLYKFRKKNRLVFAYPHVDVAKYVDGAGSGCNVPGCGGEFLARGLCRKHYQVWYRSGRG